MLTALQHLPPPYDAAYTGGAGARVDAVCSPLIHRRPGARTSASLTPPPEGRADTPSSHCRFGRLFYYVARLAEERKDEAEASSGLVSERAV